MLKKSDSLALASLLCFVSSLSSGILLGLSPAAQAGELLRLRAVGNIPLRDQAFQIFAKHGTLKSESGGRVAHYIVQLDRAVTEADRASLRAQGAEPRQYFPDDALLVAATSEALGLARLANPSIRAIVPIAPEWKLSPELLARDQLKSESLEVRETNESLVVSILADESFATAARRIANIPGARVVYEGGRDLVVDAPSSALAAIAALDAVEWVQRQPVFVSMDLRMDALDLAQPKPQDNPPALTGFESGAKIMNLDKAWSRGFDGRGQVATVADTGLDSGNISTIHPDFKATLLKGYNSGIATETWEDSMGHGTHVSGSVAGTGAASGGQLQGGAHGAQLIIQGLWSALLDNLAPGTDFDKLIGTVYRDGARIHSNSWGNARSLGEYDTFAVRVDEYMWNNPEMLVLFAAGNSGVDLNHDGHIDANSIGSPATAKNVLTVGASENQLAVGGIQKQLHELRDGEKNWGAEPVRSDRLSDNPNGIAAFSSRGPTADGRIKPEIVAPGTNIVSTRSHHPKASVLWGAYNADYAYAGGTSMATPLTAGAATVLRQYLVQERKFAAPSAALVKATLIHTATDLFPGQYGTGAGQELPTRRPNMHEGYGRVNMDEATALDSGTLLADEKAGVSGGESKSYTVQVGASGVLRATMTYTDAPGAAAASKSLVNDLDIEVVGADGKAYAKQDRLNNTEMLELSGLPRGAYTVTVKGVSVPQGRSGKQPFALAVTAR